MKALSCNGLYWNGLTLFHMHAYNSLRENTTFCARRHMWLSLLVYTAPKHVINVKQVLMESLNFQIIYAEAQQSKRSMLDIMRYSRSVNLFRSDSNCLVGRLYNQTGSWKFEIAVWILFICYVNWSTRTRQHLISAIVSKPISSLFCPSWNNYNSNLTRCGKSKMAVCKHLHLLHRNKIRWQQILYMTR